MAEEQTTNQDTQQQISCLSSIPKSYTVPISTKGTYSSPIIRETEATPASSNTSHTQFRSPSMGKFIT